MESLTALFDIMCCFSHLCTSAISITAPHPFYLWRSPSWRCSVSGDRHHIARRPIHTGCFQFNKTVCKLLIPGYLNDRHFQSENLTFLQSLRWIDTPDRG